MPTLDLLEIGTLSFEKPDTNRFRCLHLALTAGKTGHSMPAVLSGSNEIAVSAFLEGRIGFLDIPQVVEETMERHRVFPINSIDQAVEADRWAQSMAKEILKQMAGD